MMVNTEGKVGGTDLQNNLAFHAAEGGIEKMASDLNTVIQNVQVPSALAICNVGATANQPAPTWRLSAGLRSAPKPPAKVLEVPNNGDVISPIGGPGVVRVEQVARVHSQNQVVALVRSIATGAPATAAHARPAESAAATTAAPAAGATAGTTASALTTAARRWKCRRGALTTESECLADAHVNGVQGRPAPIG